MSSEDSKCLIAFFSKHGQNYYVGNVKVGNTGRMAHLIHKYLQKEGRECDLYEVDPVEEYPDNLDAFVAQFRKEKEVNERPAFKNPIDKENFKNCYSTIFLGFPIYGGDLPCVMYTFLETYREEFKGKKVIPFITHEGSNPSGLIQMLKKLLNESQFVRGLDLFGKNVDHSSAKINKWLSDIKF